VIRRLFIVMLMLSSPVTVTMPVPMSVTIWTLKQSVRIKHDFVDNEDQGVSTEGEEVRQREDPIDLSLFSLESVIIMSHFWQDVDEGHRQEDPSTRRCGQTQEGGALSTGLDLCGEDSGNEGPDPDEENEPDFYVLQSFRRN
jgi:hypothetical protein